MNRTELALACKRRGLNCCQAVLLAFADQTDLDELTLQQIGAAFGVGMGCFEATCGALCGAQMLLGLSEYEPGRPVLRHAKQLVKEFQDRAGATRCRDLKGMDTGVVLCPCEECVRHAVEIAEHALGLQAL